MAQERRINWQDCREGEKKILYKHCLKLTRSRGISILDALEKALHPETVNKHFPANFRRGRIAGSKANKVFAWISAQDRGVADAIEDAIAAYRAMKQSKADLTWEELLVRHARYGNVTVKPAPAELDIVRFRDDGPVAAFNPRVGELFYFEIACRMDGHLCAFQGSEGAWYPVPLRRDRMIVKAIEGTMSLPTDKSDKRIDPLYEKDDGRHSFVFVAVEDAKLLNTVGTLRAGRMTRDGLLDEFATALANVEDDAFAVDRVNVQVRPR